MSDGPLLNERYASALTMDEYRQQLSAALDQLGQFEVAQIAAAKEQQRRTALTTEHGGTDDRPAD